MWRSQTPATPLLVVLELPALSTSMGTPSVGVTLVYYPSQTPSLAVVLSAPGILNVDLASSVSNRDVLRSQILVTPALVVVTLNALSPGLATPSVGAFLATSHNQTPSLDVVGSAKETQIVEVEIFAPTTGANPSQIHATHRLVDPTPDAM